MWAGTSIATCWKGHNARMCPDESTMPKVPHARAYAELRALPESISSGSFFFFSLPWSYVLSHGHMFFTSSHILSIPCQATNGSCHSIKHERMF